MMEDEFGKYVYGYLFWITRMKVYVSPSYDVHECDVWFNYITSPITHGLQTVYGFLWGMLEFFMEMPEEGPMFVIMIPKKYQKYVKG